MRNLRPTPMIDPAANNLSTPDVLHGRREIDALYTSLDEALAQLHQRRLDEKLCAKVFDFHSQCRPTFLQSEPWAFFGRYILTPNREFEQFLEVVKSSRLSPFCTETADDIFCRINADKRRLCRPVFETKPDVFRGLHIMDNSSPMAGSRLKELRLKNGMSMPMFHRALMDYAFPEFGSNIIDYSTWFSAARRKDTYLHYLSLFICDGILFENFLADDVEELRFTRERVTPSFASAIELFGVRPLIVSLLPRETEGDDYWRSHSGELYAHAVDLLRQRHDSKF